MNRGLATARVALYRSLFLLAIALFVALPGMAAGDDEYFGIYMPGGKVGFMHVRKDTGVPLNGKRVVRTLNETEITIKALGTASKTISRTVSYNDPKTGLPLALQSYSEASGRVSRISATFADRTVKYTADIQGSKKVGAVTLKSGETFLQDPSSGIGDFIPRIGKKLSGKSFVPETLTLIDETVTVLGKESVPVGTGKAIPTFRVEDRSAMGTITIFMTAKGETLLFRFALGMEARKEPKAVALKVPSLGEIGKRADLAVTVGVVPTGLPIDDPRATTETQYLVRGSSGPLPPSDNRQTVTVSGTGTGRSMTVSVSARPLPDTAGIARYARPEDAPEAVRPYLLPSDYVSSNDPEFTALAKEATAGETDLAKAAARISDYVHDAIMPDSSIAVLRTASDIAKDRRGVCREYATFYTAIARNAGIPTRICVGVVLADGAFVYHAWPEVWMGETTGWIALEPTWGRPFADATHIKLAQGEITDLYRVADDMGRYRIEVLKR